MIPTILTLLALYILLFLYSLKIKDNSIVVAFWGFGFMIIAVLTFFQSERAIPEMLITGLVLLW